MSTVTKSPFAAGTAGNEPARQDPGTDVSIEVHRGRFTFATLALALQHLATTDPLRVLAAFEFESRFDGKQTFVKLILRFAHKTEAAAARAALDRFSPAQTCAEQLRPDEGEKFEFSFNGPATVSALAQVFAALARVEFVPFVGHGNFRGAAFQFQFDVQIPFFKTNPVPDLYGELGALGFSNFDPPIFSLRAWRHECDPE
jgi:hypothetical protein